MGRNVAGRNVAGRNVAGRNVFWGETSHSQVTSLLYFAFYSTLTDKFQASQAYLLLQVHPDYTRFYIDNGFELSNVGGDRILTFMLYLSNVDAGGNTIFPQPGISIKPVMGNALFWFNVGPQHQYDSNTIHLGCPVLHGNKWITTKWHRWISSYRNYPCLINKTHFSIFRTNA